MPKNPAASQGASQRLLNLVVAFGERCNLPFTELTPYDNGQGFVIHERDGTEIRVTVDSYIPRK